MKADQFNRALREMFNKLIEEGYKKHSMCVVTLGQNSNPQFDSFLKGKDLGLLPLGRLTEALQYDLHVVAVPKEDEEHGNYIAELNTSFIVNSSKELKDYLDNKPGAGRSSRTKNELGSTVDSLFDEIVGEK